MSLTIQPLHLIILHDILHLPCIRLNMCHDGRRVVCWFCKKYNVGAGLFRHLILISTIHVDFLYANACGMTRLRPGPGANIIIILFYRTVRNELYKAWR